MRLWIWRNFRIRLPDDWEMLSFSRKSAAGSCAFADRYQYRAEFSWRKLSCGPGGRPDIKRLMSDYCAKLKLEDQMPDARPTQVDSWRGLVGHIRGKTRSVGTPPPGGQAPVLPARGGRPDDAAGKTLTTRFGAYYSGESCLVELVFTWPDGRDRRLEKGILKSVREEATARSVGPSPRGTPRRGFGPAGETPPPAGKLSVLPARGGRPDDQERPGPRRGGQAPGLPAGAGAATNGYRRWKAFGMDVLASGSLELQQCTVEPASATMVFSPGRGAPRQERQGPPLPPARKERFQRLGMVPHWLRTSVGEWLERSVPRELTETVRASGVVVGHKIEALCGMMQATGIARLGEIFTGRRNHLEAAAWICPVDGRLYFSRMEARAPRSGDPSLAQERPGSTGEGRGSSSLGMAGGRLCCCADLSSARNGLARQATRPT